MDDLIRDTLWTRESLEEVLAALDPNGQVSRQVILAGPPGTGKTWIARKLVFFVTQGDASRSWFVQFHPSYSYEQFVEGLRPVAKDGAITFEIFPGVVLRSAQEAASRGERCYLIIDEINRANLPRVLGELMFLFEYRDEAIDLALTRGFKLPANLAFIGTMNTADRSIRSIDLALRRRFDIFECLPDADILERFYSQAGHESTVEDLKEGFVRLNDFLEKALDRYHTIGQTFFMAPLFTADTLVRVWKRQIFPTLAEYFFDQPEQLEALVPERFWPSIA
jgi:5-methylcytosine-specific restriction endonuclease McrBC GTP-binding regulatory subunit McrB